MSSDLSAGEKFQNELLALFCRWEGPAGESDLDADELTQLAVLAIDRYLGGPDYLKQPDIIFEPDPEILENLQDDESEEGRDDI